jgi:uncharacterized membrane protein (UPF0127 family)
VDRTGAVLVALVLAACGGLLLASGVVPSLLSGPGYQPTVTDTASETGEATDRPTESRYDHATVTVRDENGTVLGTVRAAVADTPSKRYTGLSQTASLPPDAGMLFTYDAEGSHTYVMRDMSFGIDIVYVGANGSITRIHHAPEPPAGEDGAEYRYPGTGQYVLEVDYEWTTRHGVAVGDRVEIEGL